jgi:hypothetical protein
MPYHLEKSGSKATVVSASGIKLSNHPLPHDRALAQLRAVYSHEFGHGSTSHKTGEK